MYGVPLAKKGMPGGVGRSGEPQRSRLLAPAAGPRSELLSRASEAAEAFARDASEGRRRSAQRFQGLAFQNPAPPGKTSGFLLVNRDEGVKMCTSTWSPRRRAKLLLPRARAGLSRRLRATTSSAGRLPARGDRRLHRRRCASGGAGSPCPAASATSRVRRPATPSISSSWADSRTPSPRSSAAAGVRRRPRGRARC